MKAGWVAAALVAMTVVGAGEPAGAASAASGSRGRGVPAKPVAAGEQPMRVVVVRSARPGCEPNCPEWIAAQGTIDSSSLAQFKKVLGALGGRKLPVVVDSAGGSVEDGIAIGRLIRAKGLEVAVGKTTFEPCGRTDAPCATKAGGHVAGSPVGRFAKCASACAFVLAGGVQRHVGPYSGVGVHQFRTVSMKIVRTYRVQTRQEWGIPVETRRTLVSERVVGKETMATALKDKSYEGARLFFQQMGIGPEVMQLIVATPSTKVHWLNGTELAASRLATDRLDGSEAIESFRQAAR